MKRMISKVKFYLVIVILAGMILPASAVFAKEGTHKPITQELINLVEENPKIRNMLEKSIAEAKKVNPDPKTNPIQNLSDYYDFIDRTAELLPQKILNNPSNLLPDQMQQGYCYFYFLIGQPLSELKYMGEVRNSLQYYKPFSKWLYKFINDYGAFLDTKQSWNEKIYQELYKDPTFRLQNGWYESPANWKTFNQFFARYLKSPEMRPIASPDDPSVVVSPADSVPQGVWAIDKTSNIQLEGGLKVKGETYYSIKGLLGKDSKYKEAFANGVLTHTYLNVNDYHRYHFAVGRIVKEKKIIKMNVARQVRWDPKQGKYFVVHSLDWEFSQTHGYVIVDTGEYGVVALIPVGMGLVSSVNFEKNVKVGSSHKKGDMLGYFLFGGSDIIMLFQGKAGFKMTAPVGKHLLVGEKYGVMKGETK
jgi:phosphatidylserine decarboxylase